jgi:hypothetical protein
LQRWPMNLVAQMLTYLSRFQESGSFGNLSGGQGASQNEEN